MEGDCSVNYGLDGGNVAAATLIGSIAETNTCRITRLLARLLHIHTSGGSTVDKEEEEEDDDYDSGEREKEKEKEKEGGRKRKEER